MSEKVQCFPNVLEFPVDRLMLFAELIDFLSDPDTEHVNLSQFLKHTFVHKIISILCLGCQLFPLFQSDLRRQYLLAWYWELLIFLYVARALGADFLISYFGNQNVHFLYSLHIMMLITLICEGAGLEYDYLHRRGPRVHPTPASQSRVAGSLGVKQGGGCWLSFQRVVLRWGGWHGNIIYETELTELCLMLLMLIGWLLGGGVGWLGCKNRFMKGEVMVLVVIERAPGSDRGLVEDQRRSSIAWLSWPWPVTFLISWSLSYLEDGRCSVVKSTDWRNR